MTELLFVATVIFVAYVVYTVAGDLKKKGDGDAREQKTVAAKPQSKPKPQQKKANKPIVKPVAEAEQAAPVPAAAAASSSNGLRNPETGETAANPSNYRFTKRWVKEALVAEGLLDKIYKANELDENANAKVKEALAKFKALEKYQA